MMKTNEYKQHFYRKLGEFFFFPVHSMDKPLLRSLRILSLKLSLNYGVVSQRGQLSW